MKQKKKTVAKQPPISVAKKVGNISPSSGKIFNTGILIILLVAFIAYLPALGAGFVNWDDPDYTNSDLLKNILSDPGLLFNKPIQGNYHPLTMFSLGINYAISELEPWSYHLFNLLFHLVNSYFVYRLAIRLSRGNAIIAFTTSIFFAIHPMHVESVAWVSERKDVLYCLFFIPGLISYVKYIDSGSKKQYWLSALFLLLSLLSKPAAVIFPFVLFSIDILRKRKITGKLILEKLPFLTISLAMGYITFLAQKDSGATQGASIFSLGTRFLMGTYGIFMYFIKMILPFNLNTFYPFPPINKSLPVIYLLSPLFSLMLAVWFYISLKKDRVAAFGISFYVINLILVLQILPVGSAVIAERYTYIPYIGFFYIAGFYIDRYVQNNKKKAYYLTAPVALLFAFLTYKQASVWKDSASLWDQAIKVQPSARAFNQRGFIYKEEKKIDSAIQCFEQALSINIADFEANAHLGDIYFGQNKPDLAYSYYKKALAIKPDFYQVMDNLGSLFGARGQYDSSLVYLNRALAIKPDYRPSLRNSGLLFSMQGKYEEAIQNYNRYLNYKPDDPDILNEIGACYLGLNKAPEAMVNINKAISLRPDPHFYLNRAYAYKALGNLAAARSDAMTARQGGLVIDPAFAQELGLQ